MATKTFDEIIQSLLTFLIRRNDLFDIKPTAITRTMLDAIANEIAVINNEIENVRTIQTVLNASQMTIEEMDARAANYGVSRKDPTFATVPLTFYITREPRQDITILEGTIVGTNADPALNGSVQFATVEQGTMFADRVNSYYNPATGFYEITLQAEALTPGTIGNVPINSLVRSVSTLNSNADLLLVTNKVNATGGEDQESNEDLAARLFVSISGINVGTKDGYKSTALAVPGVKDSIVVGAGDRMMVRDLNSLGEHIGGRVDVYVQGEDLDGSQDRVPFSLQQKKAQLINPVRGSVLEFSVPDSELEKYPLVSIDRVYTVIENPVLAFENQLPQEDPGSDEISVTIVQPLSGSTVDGGIDVLVRAFKPSGNITRVNLLINDAETQRMLFDNNRGLFKFTLNTAQYPDGYIQLKAEAFDEIGNKKKTGPVRINVRNLEDISVRILQPDAGTTIMGATNVVAFAYSRPGLLPRGVEIRYNGGRWIPMNEDAVANRFTFPLVASNFRPGPVKIEVRAKDNSQRTASALPRYVIVESGPSETLRTNQVRTLAIHSVTGLSANVLSRSGSHGGGSSHGSTDLQGLRAGGNFNVAKLVAPADKQFSEGDIEHRPILDDNQSVIDVNKVFFEHDGEWAGTDIGLFFSSNDARSYPEQYNSGNTVGLTFKDDHINAIEKEKERFTYIGTDGGALKTEDRKTYYRIPLPTTRPVSAFAFAKLNCKGPQ